jgi:hypothetical protein
MTPTHPRLFYGWWIVLVSAVGLFLGPVPIAVFSFAVFLKPLAQEFHSSRGAVSFAFTLHNIIVPPENCIREENEMLVRSNSLVAM